MLITYDYDDFFNSLPVVFSCGIIRAKENERPLSCNRYTSWFGMVELNRTTASTTFPENMIYEVPEGETGELPCVLYTVKVIPTFRLHRCGQMIRSTFSVYTRVEQDP